MSNICYFVVPCYNEQDALPKSAPVFLSKLTELIKDNKVDKESKILFIDDGSKDNTWSIIQDLHKQNPMFIGLKLARNCGHECALYAGLIYAKNKSDFTISMDADLQDDVSAINDFIKEYQNGAKVIFGCRNDRSKDSIFKKLPALTFYKLMQFMGLKVVSNHADYRLIAKAPLNALESYGEVNLFLRAVVADLGFKTAKVFYKRNVRTAGETKYSTFKLLALAWEAITYLVLKLLFWDKFPMGTAPILIAVLFFSSVQLFFIGIIGEYLGAVLTQILHRPVVIEKERINF